MKDLIAVTLVPYWELCLTTLVVRYYLACIAIKAWLKQPVRVRYWLWYALGLVLVTAIPYWMPPLMLVFVGAWCVGYHGFSITHYTYNRWFK
jgi:hypothetical protein